jgi:hypothetical protein
MVGLSGLQATPFRRFNSIGTAKTFLRRYICSLYFSLHVGTRTSVFYPFVSVRYMV